jgi:hypothetical protein
MEVIKILSYIQLLYYFCGSCEKVGKSNNFKNELTMFTP